MGECLGKCRAVEFSRVLYLAICSREIFWGGVIFLGGNVWGNGPGNCMGWMSRSPCKITSHAAVNDLGHCGSVSYTHLTLPTKRIV